MKSVTKYELIAQKIESDICLSEVRCVTHLYSILVCVKLSTLYKSLLTNVYKYAMNCEHNCVWRLWIISKEGHFCRSTTNTWVIPPNVNMSFTKLGWHSWRIPLNNTITHIKHSRRPVYSIKQRRLFILCSSINKAGLLQNGDLTSLMKSAYFSPSMAINLFNTVLCQGGGFYCITSRH